MLIGPGQTLTIGSWNDAGGGAEYVLTLSIAAEPLLGTSIRDEELERLKQMVSVALGEEGPADA